jgi:hypothetical protein
MAAERRGGGGAGRLALILALLALVLAWAAYRRTGGELRTLWRDLAPAGGERVRITAGSEEEDLRPWLARARARLEGRRAEVAGESNLQQVRAEVAELRESLSRYRDTGAKAKEGWRELDADLERLEGQLKEGGAKALATLDSALRRIRSAAGEEK